jgi:SagB-type dehydrogenase family enzyme
MPTPAHSAAQRPDHRISLSPQATLIQAGGQVVVWRGDTRVTVDVSDEVLVMALQTLDDGPVSITELETAALALTSLAGDPAATLTRLRSLISRLGPALLHTLFVGDEELLRLVQLTSDTRFEPSLPKIDQPVALSRLSFMRRRGDCAVLESGGSPYRLELGGPTGLELAAALTRPVTVGQLAAGAGLAEPVAAAFVAFLAAAGMTDADDDQHDQWNFHELLFHSRSRLGRHDEPFGATLPFLGRRPPSPPVKEPPAGRTVELSRPQLDELIDSDPPLALALEGRRSVCDYGDEPMTVDQLGEFLYRVGRVRAVFGPDELQGMPYEAVDRPYPTGGGTGELEIYVTAHRVAGLDRAAYYYDAARHRLIEVCADSQLLDGLLTGAVEATRGGPAPDALLTFTSRFERLTWKYDGMAYATTLKHVGVAYQTCYLVATAMRLAPCGLGSGDAQLSVRAFGLDWQVESSVGEFMLGSLPDWADGTDPQAGRANWRPGLDPQWSTHAARLLSGLDTPL